jgi:hypothetical protein
MLGVWGVGGRNGTPLMTRRKPKADMRGGQRVSVPGESGIAVGERTQNVGGTTATTCTRMG